MTGEGGRRETGSDGAEVSRVRSERRGSDVQFSDTTGFERSGAGVSEHGRDEETQARFKTEGQI